MTYSFSDWRSGALPPKGWDCAEAIEDGWTKVDLEAYMRAMVVTVTGETKFEDLFPGVALNEKSPRKPQERDLVDDMPWLSEAPPINGPDDYGVVLPATVIDRKPDDEDEGEDAPVLVMDCPLILSIPTAVDADWRTGLVTNADGKTLPNLTRNWTLFLENLPETKDMLAYDEFANETMFVSRPPWDVSRGKWVPRPVKDVDLSEAVEWLERLHLTPKISTIAPVIEKIAARRPYHPVRNYFASLPVWDGNNRLDTFLTVYLGAPDTPLTRAIGRKWLCAAVWRVFKPGCKFDHVLVLQGAQGLGKSEFGKALVPLAEWVSEGVNVADKSREVIENTSGILIVELAELAGKSNKEVEAVKKFITVTHDKARGAYKRKTDTVPRQFVFYATTNRDEFLTDATGNRRWWPVVPARIDLDRIRADRDQIWAEVLAVHRSEALWLDDPQLQAALDDLNKTKTDYGPTFELICDLIPNGDMLLPATEARKLLTGGSEDTLRMLPGWRPHLHSALSGLGFKVPSQVVRNGGGTCRAYIRGDVGKAQWAVYSAGRIVFEPNDPYRDEAF